MGTAINLSAASANNLLALQRTTAAINRTQERLATGLKVNSAVDNSVAFFDAATLTGRATALQLLKDDIDQAVSSVQSAVDGIEATALDRVEAYRAMAKHPEVTSGLERFFMCTGDVTQWHVLAKHYFACHGSNRGGGGSAQAGPGAGRDLSLIHI